MNCFKPFVDDTRITAAAGLTDKPSAKLRRAYSNIHHIYDVCVWHISGQEPPNIVLLEDVHGFVESETLEIVEGNT